MYMLITTCLLRDLPVSSPRLGAFLVFRLSLQVLFYIVVGIRLAKRASKCMLKSDNMYKPAYLVK